MANNKKDKHHQLLQSLGPTSYSQIQLYPHLIEPFVLLERDSHVYPLQTPILFILSLRVCVTQIKGILNDTKSTLRAREGVHQIFLQVELKPSPISTKNHMYYKKNVVGMLHQIEQRLDVFGMLHQIEQEITCGSYISLLFFTQLSARTGHVLHMWMDMPAVVLLEFHWQMRKPARKIIPNRIKLLSPHKLMEKTKKIVQVACFHVVSNLQLVSSTKACFDWLSNTECNILCSDSIKLKKLSTLAKQIENNQGCSAGHEHSGLAVSAAKEFTETLN